VLYGTGQGAFVGPLSKSVAALATRIIVISTRGEILLDSIQVHVPVKKDFSLCFEMTAFKVSDDFEGRICD